MVSINNYLANATSDENAQRYKKLIDHHRKIVRFADSVGLDLCKVALIDTSSEPDCTVTATSAATRLHYCNSFPIENDQLKHLRNSIQMLSTLNYISMFKRSYLSRSTTENENEEDESTVNNAVEMDKCYKFRIENIAFEWSDSYRDTLRTVASWDRDNIQLEQLTLNGISIDGLVNVKNVCYHKKVYITYTLDNWRTVSRLQCAHKRHEVANDLFEFTLTLDEPHIMRTIESNYLPTRASDPVTTINRRATSAPHFRLELAASMETRSSRDYDDPHYDNCYWDNNLGLNYFIDCFFKINLN